MADANFKQLKQLWLLKLVVETGSIKKAALKTKVTSSAVSQSLSDLEQKLGNKLLYRQRDFLLPTDYAQQVLASATPTMDAWDALQKSLATTCFTAPRMSWLDLAVSDSLSKLIVPALIGRLRLHLPHLRLKLKTGTSASLTKAVKKSELCMAVVEENPELSGANALTVGEDRLGLYCSAQTPDIRKASRVLDSIGFGTIAPSIDGHSRHYKKFIRSLSPRKPILTTESYDLLREAAIEGSLAAILPQRIARKNAEDLYELREPEMLTQNIFAPYKLYLVSEPGCSKEETNFVAREARAIFVRG